MSILKSIMHHWNKTTKTYDTLHPETESAQITDWHSGIMASLASTTLGTVVSAVTTDSVLGKLIKMLLDASGVKYLIDANGYVCFGSLFGGLIIQWVYCGMNNSTNSDVTISWPISGTFLCAGMSTSDSLTISAFPTNTNIRFRINGSGTGGVATYALGVFKA